jgi:hypothetical protein
MKDAPYFSHDSNARHDRKILPMRTKYGAEGYGWYWMLVEMMREEDGYKLSVAETYDIDAYAMQMQCDSKDLRRFIKDCIEKYDLFKSENGYIWSESLIRRMKVLEKRREQARAAARKRWGTVQEQCDGNADAMREHSGGNAFNKGNKGNKGKEQLARAREEESPPPENHSEENPLNPAFTAWQRNEGTMGAFSSLIGQRIAKIIEWMESEISKNGGEGFRPAADIVAESIEEVAAMVPPRDNPIRYLEVKCEKELEEVLYGEAQDG